MSHLMPRVNRWLVDGVFGGFHLTGSIHVAYTWHNCILIGQSTFTGLWLDDPHSFWVEVSGSFCFFFPLCVTSPPYATCQTLIRLYHEGSLLSMPRGKKHRCHYLLGHHGTSCHVARADWFVPFRKPNQHTRWQKMTRLITLLVLMAPAAQWHALIGPCFF